MDLIKKLQERREKIVEQLRNLVAKVEARKDAATVALEAATDETREQLSSEARDAGAFTEDEQREFDGFTAEVRSLDARITELQEAEAREAAAAEQRARMPEVRVGREETTYRQGGEHSFLRDAVLRFDDVAASDRLRRNAAEMADHFRDVDTSAFGTLVVPAYLTDLYAPKLRARRPFLNQIRNEQLPDEGMTVEIPRGTTGTGVAAQATQGSAVQETNYDETDLSIPVNTYAGMQDVSRQAVERGRGTDSIIVTDLLDEYHTKLDAATLHGDGTSGTHEGVFNADGGFNITWTDASPTVPEFLLKLADGIQRIQAAHLEPDLIVLAPRRWGWIVGYADASNRPLAVVQGYGPNNAAGLVEAPGGSNRVVGSIHGLPVLVDGNILTNLGAGTEDVAAVVDSQELFIWEQAGQPVGLRLEEVLGNSLQIRFVLYGYSAFTAERRPEGFATIAGTGMIAPTF